MKCAVTFGLFLFLVVSPSSAIGNGTSADTDVFLKQIFSYANAGNLKALEKIKDKVSGETNKTIVLAYSLALYIASPDRYERQYVEAFPVDFESIMYDLYEQVELKQLTPAFLYSVVAIGSIAKKGNEKAIEKVFKGYAHSDGAVAASFCDSIVGLLKGQTQRSISVLSRMGKDERQTDYRCLNTVTTEELAEIMNNIERLTPTASRQEGLVIQEIREFKQPWPGR